MRQAENLRGNFKMKLDLTTEQIIGLLGMYVADHASRFQAQMITDDYYYLTAIAGSLSEHEPGTRLEYRISRKPDYEADGLFDYQVFARAWTGWQDEPHGDWRWQCDVAVDPSSYGDDWRPTGGRR
jgi:hypothetical protein